MELQRLDDIFQAHQPIDNYESLIWTERYSSSGDFELVSSDISKCLAQMPLESFVGLRESTVPMVVESHKIVKAKNSVPKIQIRGRSFDSVLERRASIFGAMPYGGARPVWSPSLTKPSDAAYFAMRTVLGDIARAKGGAAISAVAPAVSPLDAIPQINTPVPFDYAVPNAGQWNPNQAYVAGNQVTYAIDATTTIVYEATADSTNVSPIVGTPSQWKNLGTLAPYEIKPGNLYSAVLELLRANHHGIKAVRPVHGDASKTTVDLEIYNGADLTATTIFDVKFDQFDDATYLLSFQGSTNIAYVFGGGPATDSGNGVRAGGTLVRKNNAGAEVSGLNRRVLLVDEQSDATINTAAIRTSRGLVELYKNNSVAIFDGELARQIAERYNKSVNSGGYSLGDIVMLNGEYGLSRKVRVAEFIRSFDATGQSAYPAFEVIDE